VIQWLALVSKKKNRVAHRGMARKEKKIKDKKFPKWGGFTKK
jgi:hypothetical protein